MKLASNEGGQVVRLRENSATPLRGGRVGQRIGLAKKSTRDIGLQQSVGRLPHQHSSSQCDFVFDQWLDMSQGRQLQQG
jgi:hypothetical protein